MLDMVKSLVKPAFYIGLKALTELHWRRRKPGSAHGLPGRLVVSLTSWPGRFDVLDLTLKTLMTQDVAADVIVLWIAHQDMEKLPPSVRALERDGLVIRATDDLRSYKKIIPALQEYSDAFIVTADDDVYYAPGWLQTFCEAYVPNEKAVLAYRAHRMIFTGDKLAPYDRWTFEMTDTTPGNDVFFTGVGGVFYAPGILHLDTTDIALLRKLCPTGDDIWLNWMARLNGATVRKVGLKMRFYEWPGSQGVALQNSNRGENSGNDRQIANIIAHYGMVGIQP